MTARARWWDEVQAGARTVHTCDALWREACQEAADAEHAPIAARAYAARVHLEWARSDKPPSEYPKDGIAAAQYLEPPVVPKPPKEDRRWERELDDWMAHHSPDDA